jgi:hypothetical protein
LDAITGMLPTRLKENVPITNKYLIMRKILLILTVLMLSNLCYSQEPLKWEEVVIVDSTITKNELFNRARHWFSMTFKSEKDVISISDKESGEISGNGLLSYKSDRFYVGVVCVNGNVNFKINIYVKDGRYKYIFHSFIHEGSFYDGSRPISYGELTNSEIAPKPTRGGPNAKAWAEIKEQTSSQIDVLITSLKVEMAKTSEANDNW